jgi:hypothetical protein
LRVGYPDRRRSDDVCCRVWRDGRVRTRLLPSKNCWDPNSYPQLHVTNQYSRSEPANRGARSGSIARSPPAANHTSGASRTRLSRTRVPAAASPKACLAGIIFVLRSGIPSICQTRSAAFWVRFRDRHKRSDQFPQLVGQEFSRHLALLHSSSSEGCSSSGWLHTKAGFVRGNKEKGAGQAIRCQLGRGGEASRPSALTVYLVTNGSRDLLIDK